MAPLPDWSSWGFLPCVSRCTELWVCLTSNGSSTRLSQVLRPDLTVAQIPELATFGDGCLGLVAYLPTAVAFAVLFCRYALRPVWRQRPWWLRSFADEKGASFDPGLDESLQQTKRWSGYAISLFALSFIASVASVLLAIVFDFGPLFLVPLIPSVRSLILASRNTTDAV